MTAARVEFGFAERGRTVWCAKRVTTREWMLCGRRKGWMPPVPHLFVPADMCPDCQRMLDLGSFVPVPDEQVEGTCPVCVGRAPLDGRGLVAAHDQWSWADGRLVVRVGEACSGAGQRPEYEG